MIWLTRLCIGLIILDREVVGWSRGSKPGSCRCVAFFPPVIGIGPAPEPDQRDLHR
jgi:hypothetical protein